MQRHRVLSSQNASLYATTWARPPRRHREDLKRPWVEDVGMLHWSKKSHLHSRTQGEPKGIFTEARSCQQVFSRSRSYKIMRCKNGQKRHPNLNQSALLCSQCSITLNQHVWRHLVECILLLFVRKRRQFHLSGRDMLWASYLLCQDQAFFNA